MSNRWLIVRDLHQSGRSRSWQVRMGHRSTQREIDPIIVQAASRDLAPCRSIICPIPILSNCYLMFGPQTFGRYTAQMSRRSCAAHLHVAPGQVAEQVLPRPMPSGGPGRAAPNCQAVPIVLGLFQKLNPPKVPEHTNDRQCRFSPPQFSLAKRDSMSFGEMARDRWWNTRYGPIVDSMNVIPRSANRWRSMSSSHG
jgi:hypothetical protein